MNRDRLKDLARLLGASAKSTTVYGIVVLYLVGTGAMTADNSLFGPGGLVDVRLWINGQIVQLPQIVSTLCAALALYGRAKAKGPLMPSPPPAPVPSVAGVAGVMPDIPWPRLDSRLSPDLAPKGASS